MYKNYFSDSVIRGAMYSFQGQSHEGNKCDFCNYSRQKEKQYFRPVTRGVFAHYKKVVIGHYKKSFVAQSHEGNFADFSDYLRQKENRVFWGSHARENQNRFPTL